MSTNPCFSTFARRRAASAQHRLRRFLPRNSRGRRRRLAASSLSSRLLFHSRSDPSRERSTNPCAQDEEALDVPSSHRIRPGLDWTLVSALRGNQGGALSVADPSGSAGLSPYAQMFSTPEIHIGFHPDAGASFYLSHLTGHIGEYLALTGERLNGIDMLAVGLATHYTISARLDWVDERLAKLITDDPSTIDTSLSTYGDIVYPDKNSIVNRLEVIDKCFGLESVEEILDALETEAARSKQEWCTVALKKLKEASPLSLKVALRSVREGRFQTLDECLVREYRMSLHGISKPLSHDFLEGVRARLVNKDFTPKWDPPTLDKVPEDMVDHYFSPLGDLDSELKLPTHLREAFI
ncbi:hypothetical protein ZIOFF_058352 [Zingiber officinale]|uniref:3-hydroxyisobutyryl-CoA hydrolase n=1 Tax=Zingiber officinale TaxID=94328 RepID=A0A8J5F9K4_ZINOF|nr:hypothetical protein ZIOFF_058352 [Zingiber officinale]